MGDRPFKLRVIHWWLRLALSALTISLTQGKSHSTDYCRKPLRIELESFVISEVWETESSRFLDIRWRLPERMTLQEHFGFKFRDETGKLLRSPVLSMEQAACGYDDSCRYRLSIYPYDIFKPCSKYNISIQIKGPDLYCTEPDKIYQIHVTKTEAPSSVLDLSFVNQINSFWKGQIKWKPPEISSCVHSYRVAYLEPSSGTSLSRGGTWHQGQTIDLYYDIEGLTRCTSYQVRVGAVATDGAQGEMHTKTFRTWGCFGSPLALKSTAASLAPKSTNWYLVLLGVNTISHLGALRANMCKDK